MNRCSGCGLHACSFVVYGHVDSPVRTGLCPECRNDPRIQEELQKLFAEEISARRQSWSGPTGNKLALLKNRIVKS